MVFRAELRRRWGAWLALSLLVALVAGTVLAGVSAARRTASAFPDYVQQYGVDAQAYGFPDLPRTFYSLPNVDTVSTQTYYLNGNALIGSRTISGTLLNVSSIPATHLSKTIKLVSGRLPTSPNEVLVGFSFAQQYRLHQGSVVTVSMYARSQLRTVLNSQGNPPTHGPVLRLVVTGIGLSISDFPTSSPNYSIFTSRSFTRVYGPRIANGAVANVRLTHGAADLPHFQVAVNHLRSRDFTFFQSADDATAAIEGSIHPQAVAWWLFALIAFLAGLALVGQALSRQSIVERESYPTLSSIGFLPVQVFALGMTRALVIGATGAAGALTLAVLLSPLTPVGEARAAEPTSGLYFDVATFGLGIVAIVAVVLLLGALPAWRAAKVRAQEHQDRAWVGGGSRVVEAAARMGAPPPMLIGTRYALERRRGRASVPVATALVGTVAAVTALVASVVFGASLSTLLATPRLYGINWQVSMQNLTGFQVHSLARALNANPTVDKVSYGVVGKLVDVNGVSTPAFMTDVSKGPMAFTLVDGRYPSGDHETALGTKTLASAHASVGSTVQVKIVTNKGHTVVRQFRVVGEVVLPPGNSPAIGVGAVLSVRAAVLALCPPTLSAARCTSQFEPLIIKQATWFAVIGTVPGRRGDATIASLEARYAPYLSEIVVPTNLVNFGQAINFPALLGLTLALFGVATLAHLLLVSVSRRRKEVALLKVLGFVRRQVSAAVCWQATTVCLIGIVVGVPVGIIVGRSTWELFATAVGVEPVAVVPAQQVVVVAIGAIVVGNILAVVPAALAARLRPAEALRAT